MREFHLTDVVVFVSEKRQYVRERSQGAVQLAWTDSAGLLHTSRGECVDISPSGLRVELRDRIQQRTVVQIKVLGSPLGTEYCNAGGECCSISRRF